MPPFQKVESLIEDPEHLLLAMADGYVDSDEYSDESSSPSSPLPLDQEAIETEDPPPKIISPLDDDFPESVRRVLIQQNHIVKVFK